MARHLLLATMPGVALSAQPAPQPNVLRGLQVQEQRVQSIGYRLAVAGRDLCREAPPQAGLSVHTLNDYALRRRGEARATFEFDDWPVALAVATNGPAAGAGIMPDDAILSIDGQSEQEAVSLVASDARTLAVSARLDAAAARGTMRLTIRHAGQERDVTISPARACLTRFQVRDDDARNALANGRYVEITTGLLAYLRSDDELAAVLAHELAHNMLEHRAQLDAAGLDPARRKLSRRDAALIRATEIEADRFSVYLVDRAGYSVAAIPAYWQRVRQDRGGRRGRFRLHADELERVAVVDAEIARIDAARASGVVPSPPPAVPIS